MKNTYLVQRLKKPFKSENKLTKLSNVFAFGGGLVNGGIPEEGMKTIKDIFRFDYMGSAEFEFGAVPEALSKIAENFEKLIAFTLHAPYEHKNWYLETNAKGIKPIYVICEKEHRDEIVIRIKGFAKKDYNDTKERICLNESLAKEKIDDIADIVGWLELDNGFFFFSDKEMFNKTCKLFDVNEEGVLNGKDNKGN